MAKKEMPDKLGGVLGGSGPRATTPPAARPSSKLVAHHINMREDDWELLRQHFEDQGLSVSSGIRQVLALFLKREGLR